MNKINEISNLVRKHTISPWWREAECTNWKNDHGYLSFPANIFKSILKFRCFSNLHLLITQRQSKKMLIPFLIFPVGISLALNMHTNTWSFFSMVRNITTSPASNSVSSTKFPHEPPNKQYFPDFFILISHFLWHKISSMRSPSFQCLYILYISDARSYNTNVVSITNNIKKQ